MVERLDDFARRTRAGAADGIEGALDAERSVVRRGRVQHAVRQKKHQVTGSERHRRSGGESTLRGETERTARARQPLLHGTFAVQHIGRRVPCVAIDEGVGGRVEPRQEQRDETVFGNIVGK